MASRSSSGLLSKTTVSSGGGATRRAFQSAEWLRAREARRQGAVDVNLTSPSSLTSPVRTLDENIDFAVDDESTGFLVDTAAAATAAVPMGDDRQPEHNNGLLIFSPVVSATPSVRATPNARRVIPLSARQLVRSNSTSTGSSVSGEVNGGSSSRGCLLFLWDTLGRLNGGSELQVLLPIAAPVMASSCLSQFLNIVDLLFVGRYLGPEYLAAAALGNCWFNILSALLLGGAAGLDALLSESIDKFEEFKITHITTKTTTTTTASTTASTIETTPTFEEDQLLLSTPSHKVMSPPIPSTTSSQQIMALLTPPSRSEIGLLAQRNIGLMSFTALPIVAAGLWSTESFLITAHQDPVLSATAAGFCDALVLGLLPLAVSTSLARYMAAAGHTWAVIAVDLAANFLNVTLNFSLIGVDGFLGAPLATSAARFAHLIMLVAFFRARAASQIDLVATWPGFQPGAAMGDVRGLAKMAQSMLHGVTAVALESWPLELSYLLAGLLDHVPSLDAHVVALNTCVLISLIPHGLGVAAGARIPVLLSAGDSNGAQRLCYVALIVSFFYNLCIALLLIILSGHIGVLFTKDIEVAEACSHISFVAALFQIVDGFQCCLGGILRGLGHNRKVTVFRFVGWGVIGLPAAVAGAFLMNGGLVGIWVGLLLGLTSTASSFLIVFGSIDWDSEASKAVAVVSANAVKAAAQTPVIFTTPTTTLTTTPITTTPIAVNVTEAVESSTVRLRRSTKEMMADLAAAASGETNT